MPKQSQAKVVPLTEFTLDQANTRRHPERNRATIRASLDQFGAGRSVVADRDNVIRAGNGTLEQAIEAGMEALVVEPRPNQLVVVRRPDWSPTQAIAYGVADNRSGDLAENDDVALAEVLRGLQSEDFNLAAVGFEDAEVDALLEGLASEAVGGDGGSDPGPQTDRAAELQEKWQVERGDLWEIESATVAGKCHYLLCGDSTKPEDVARLMGDAKADICFTSPPYASQREYDESSGFEPIHPDEYGEWFASVQLAIASVLGPRGSYFLNIKEHCEGGQRHLYVKDLTISHVREWGWMFVDEFCWRDTKNGVPGGWNNRFKDAWEPVFHFARQGDIKFNPTANGSESDAVFEYSPATAKTATGSGLLGVKATVEHAGIARPSNVIECAAASTGGHSAAFPVGLPEFFVKAFSDRGDSVFEPFSGSGTTLVACESTGRLGYGIELAPKFVAVALERLSGMGLAPKRT
jgi:site-specific DNA-methyltransferase (adenine-specific)